VETLLEKRKRKQGETMMKAHLILAFPLLLASAGAVLAQTPDGQTPAQETVCDHESGAAFGLCNAYCEAMDCDSANPQASATACGKVKAKFTNITGRTSLPCEGPVCPCNVPGTDFGDYVAGNITITECRTGNVAPGETGIALNRTAAAFQGFNGFWNCAPPITRISEEQYQVCFQLLEQAAANQNVTCVVQ
jgi:hypothetical protein